ncbi:MAG: phytoene/squalene synthase family protein [Methanomicrobiales archaeon]|nr:phytoene/squalene synthase family protein [Methanomicrobiales archaeon]
MDEAIRYRIFREGSRTYFYSSLFFPPDIRRDVFKLYAFVRTADDLVDCIPQKEDEFHRFCERWEQSSRGEIVGDPVIDGFSELARRKEFSEEWTRAFLSSMEKDLSKREYDTMEELDRYLYGSAEVIGLFMGRILGLPAHCFEEARLLGRAMQFVNFIRDISEDIGLGRTYFPQRDLNTFGLTSLHYEGVSRNPEAFRAFMRFQIGRYFTWQRKAERGFSLIPYRYLIPIKTASDMYNWTASVIEGDPFVVYRHKVKPKISRIFLTLCKNVISIPVRRSSQMDRQVSYGV